MAKAKAKATAKRVSDATIAHPDVDRYAFRMVPVGAWTKKSGPKAGILFPASEDEFISLVDADTLADKTAEGKEPYGFISCGKAKLAHIICALSDPDLFAAAKAWCQPILDGTVNTKAVPNKSAQRHAELEAKVEGIETAMTSLAESMAAIAKKVS